MRLLCLHITGFGGLREREITFGDGVTVLLGPNEAGKSSVLHCIAQVLMGRPTQRSQFPDFTPWDGGMFEAALDIEREGAHFRLVRRFGEGGPRAVALLCVRADGSEQLLTREASEVRRWVAETFGTADDRIFYRVFCLTQADLHPLDQYAGLREQLERATSGAEEAVAAAIQRIDARLAALRRGVGQPALLQNWGPLKRAEEARRDWEARLHEARRQQKRLEEVRADVGSLRERMTGVGARRKEIAALLEQDRTRRSWRARREELRASWASLEQTRERIAKLQGERDRLQAGCPPDVESLAERIDAHVGGNGPSPLAWVFAACGLLAGMGLLVAGKVGVGVALLAVLFFVVSLLLLRVTKVKREQAARYQSLGVTDAVQARRRLADVERQQRDLAATTLALEALAGTEADEERRRTIAIEVAALEEKLSQLPGEALSSEAALRLVREEQQLEPAMARWQDELHGRECELAVLEQADRDLVDIEDGVVYWRQEEARAREDEQALALARAWLIEAGQQTHRTMADPLTAAISPLFSAMTGGCYRQVCVESDARSFALHPLDADGAPIPPDQLSQGTRDQLLLAARLALGEVLAGPLGVPIFLLDDPLLHFDAARRREALAMLGDLATRSQIILATHDGSILDDLPGAIIVNLAHPSAISA